MSNTYVKRTTLFKIPKDEDIETVLKQYEVLRKNAVKVTLFNVRPCLYRLQLKTHERSRVRVGL